MKVRHERPRRAVIHTSAKDRQGGYVLIMFAMLLIPLLLLVGFSVDVGSWYNRSAEMQKASDAAALAGVVWLPDETRACQVARETAEKNGFDDDDPNIDVTCSKSATVANRLQVAVRDRRVGSFIYSAVGGDDLDMRRNAYAEYVTPVPMGSPRNYFGTGQMLTGTYRENLYQSVNTYCSAKANGDRHQSAFSNGTTADVRTSCNNTPNNSDFRSRGYELYIDAVAGRPADIELRLLDPQFNTGLVTYPAQVIGQNCTTTYTYTWPTGTTGYTIQTTNRTSLTGPLQYQTRTSSTSTTWSPSTPNVVGQGQTQNGTFTANRYRTRSPLTVLPNTVCTPILSSAIDYAALDRYFRTTRGTPTPPENYTVQLYRADNTPLNDDDNPLICEQTVAPTTAYDSYEYLGSRRWMTLRTNNTMTTPCNITTSMPNGRYIFRIHNANAAASSTANKADGENNWGLVARYTNASGDGICDGRTDTMCPRVYGKDAISVRAVSSASVADFFLAEISPAHTGKKLRIELWDPGEGGESIEILTPNGTDSWTTHTFDWSEPGTGSGTNVSILPVTNSNGDRFNAKLVTITVDLDGYAPPADNEWWKIRYRFSGSGVNDRTTWSARILGDPVHLVEE